jgi:hypothetical protein
LNIALLHVAANSDTRNVADTESDFSGKPLGWPSLKEVI